MGATHFTGPVIVGDPSTTPSQQGELELYQDIIILGSQTAAAGTYNFLLNIPPGSVIMGFEVIVTTVWNSATSAAMSVGSDATTNKAIYFTVADLKAVTPPFATMVQTNAQIAAQRGYTILGVPAPIPGPINIQIVTVGATTQGAALVSVHYVQVATP